MADEDKEKAEKVAAARKRYEELKKQKAKKEEGGNKKKKSKKAKEDKDKEADSSKAANDKADGDEEDDDNAEEDDDKKDETRPSLTEQSRMRSEEFKKDSPLNAKVEQLEADNKKLQQELQEKLEALAKAEEESKEAAGGLEKELEKLTQEIVALKRQNTNLQASAKRRPSESNTKKEKDELSTQLQSKTSAVETMEVELSNVKHNLTEVQEKVSSLEAELKSEKASHETSQKSLADLRASIEAKDDSAKSDDDPVERAREAEAKVSLLNSDVAAAQKAAAEANSRADSLEKKVETLTNLHKEAQEKLKAPPNPRARKSVDGDDGGLDELEDEERKQMAVRIRELEAEVYELRRGVWKDQRRAMQGEMEDEAVHSPGAFSDVDLSSGYGQQKSRRQSSGYNTFANVINAFTGGAGQPSGRQRGQSAATGGFMEDDDELDFDEDAFRQAQEDEAKNRLERIKETKRGLPKWKGWRVDLVDQRGGEYLGVFDI